MAFKAIKSHVTLSLMAYSLLRLASLALPGVEVIEAEPWWAPQGAAQRDAAAPRVCQGLWNFGQFASKSPKCSKIGRPRRQPSKTTMRTTPKRREKF